VPVSGGIGNYGGLHGLDPANGHRVKSALLALEGAMADEPDDDAPELEFDSA
jgi:hypothetical protein